MHAIIGHQPTRNPTLPNVARIVLATGSALLRDRVTLLCDAYPACFEVHCVVSLADIVDAASAERVALILLGENLRGGTLLEAVHALKKNSSPKIALMQDPDTATRASLLRAGVFSVVDTTLPEWRQADGTYRCPLKEALGRFLHSGKPCGTIRQDRAAFDWRGTGILPDVAGIGAMRRAYGGGISIH
jgi:hypothetical protein